MRGIARRQVLLVLRSIRVGSIRIQEQGGVTECGESFEGASLQATIVVHDRRFWQRVVLGGAVGAGDSYVAGMWDCHDLPVLIRILLRNREVFKAIDGPLSAFQKFALSALAGARKNSLGGARHNVRKHYDLGNGFFELFLDETMTYSSALFPEGTLDLRLAQETKNRRLCEYLKLSSRDHLLEIGSGWGEMAVYAAKNYGCTVTTTTIAERQFERARERVAREGLQGRVTVLLSDYRDLTGQYDKLVSVEMLEAVGPEHLAGYFATCADLLRSDGLAAFQMTTMLDGPFRRSRRAPDFIAARVFPGSHIPSFASLYEAISRGGGFRLYDYQELSSHYAVTLREWRKRFWTRQQRIRALGFPDGFLRTWDYYLGYCQGAFEERYINCGQLVLARDQYRGQNLWGASTLATAFVQGPSRLASAPRPSESRGQS